MFIPLSLHSFREDLMTAEIPLMMSSVFSSVTGVLPLVIPKSVVLMWRPHPP